MPGTAAGADSAAEWGEDGQGEAGGGDRVHRRGNAECTLVRTHWVPGLGAGHPQRRAGATYPQETVQFPHGHLLGSVHSLKHLLLMLGGKGRWALSPRLCSPTCLSVCLCVFLLSKERDHLGTDRTEALHNLSLVEKRQAGWDWGGAASYLHHPAPSWTEHLWS